MSQKYRVRVEIVTREPRAAHWSTAWESATIAARTSQEAALKVAETLYGIGARLYAPALRGGDEPPAAETIVSEVSAISEVSANWPSSPGDRPTLVQKFESTIKVNRARGYALRDWRLSQNTQTIDGLPVMTETIIAVFDLVSR